jgi:hypothetical protein
VSNEKPVPPFAVALSVGAAITGISIIGGAPVPLLSVVDVLPIA